MQLVRDYKSHDKHEMNFYINKLNIDYKLTTEQIKQCVLYQTNQHDTKHLFTVNEALFIKELESPYGWLPHNSTKLVKNKIINNLTKLYKTARYFKFDNKLILTQAIARTAIIKGEALHE